MFFPSVKVRFGSFKNIFHISLYHAYDFHYLLFFLTFYLFERERKRESGEEAEREGDREFKAGSRLRAVHTEPDAGLELTSCEIMTRAEVEHFTDRATQAP